MRQQSFLATPQRMVKRIGLSRTRARNPQRMIKRIELSRTRESSQQQGARRRTTR
jgi:hypothetical protein